MFEVCIGHLSLMKIFFRVDTPKYFPYFHQFNSSKIGLSLSFFFLFSALYSLEEDWTEIVRNAHMLSEKARSQQQALWELVETEVAYIRTLKVIQDVRSSSKLLFFVSMIYFSFFPYSILVYIFFCILTFSSVSTFKFGIFDPSSKRSLKSEFQKYPKIFTLCISTYFT